MGMTREREEDLAAISGLVLWAIALVLLATVFRPDLQRHHATWWLWSCGLALLVGLYGLNFTRRRRRR